MPVRRYSRLDLAQCPADRARRSARHLDRPLQKAILDKGPKVCLKPECDRFLCAFESPEGLIRHNNARHIRTEYVHFPLHAQLSECNASRSAGFMSAPTANIVRRRLKTVAVISGIARAADHRFQKRQSALLVAFCFLGSLLAPLPRRSRQRNARRGQSRLRSHPRLHCNPPMDWCSATRFQPTIALPSLPIAPSSLRLLWRHARMDHRIQQSHCRSSSRPLC